MRAGQLRERITFSKRTDVTDEYGNPTTGAFADQFTVYARVQYVKGGEGMVAARLQGSQPVVITTRRDAQTEQVQVEWRAVDANDASKIYNIRSVTPSERKELIDFLCEAGVAT